MGGSPDLKTGYSPQQQQIMTAGQPAYKRAGALAGEGLGLYGIGDSPMAPSYNVVNPEIMMPTQQWWESMSPNVKQGLWAPYQEAGKGLMETLGTRGQSGSARGGYSGAAGVAMGELASRGAKDVGMQAWQMSQPAMSQYWNALQQREMYQPMADYEQAKAAWMQEIISKQQAQQAVLNPYGATANQGAAAWVPSTASRIGAGIFGAIGGYSGGGGYGGAISGFGSGYYGGGSGGYGGSR